MGGSLVSCFLTHTQQYYKVTLHFAHSRRDQRFLNSAYMHHQDEREIFLKIRQRLFASDRSNRTRTVVRECCKSDDENSMGKREI